MRTIHFFGDSWTKGDGCQFEPGTGQTPSFIKFGPDYSTEYSKYSFPAQLGTLLDNQFNINNKGATGSSNFQIYKIILQSLEAGEIKKNDIAIVNWTSIVREPLTFLFTIQNRNIEWESHGIDNSLKGYLGENEWTPSWVNNIENNKLKEIHHKIYKDYIIDRINLNILYEMCMNYICNLQIIFKELGVEFLFVNAFENIISENISFYKKIDKTKWVLFDSTLSEYLHEIENTLDLSIGYSLWEDDFIKPGIGNDGPHPNRIGYSYISKLILNELKNKNII